MRPCCRRLFGLGLLAVVLFAANARAAEVLFYHAATNTDLQAVANPPPANRVTVMRDGFAAAGDGGAALYTYSSSPNCPNPDDGAQVSPNGTGTVGCWYATLRGLVDVRIWGVPTDGVTNARPALQAAINAAEASDPSLTLYLPAGGVETTGDTHSNATLDNLGTTTGVVVGQQVLGLGIPSGTTVTVINSSTSVTLSHSVTGSHAGIAVSFGPVIFALTDGTSLRINRALRVVGGGWLTSTSNAGGDNNQGTTLLWDPSAPSQNPMLTIESSVANNYLSHGAVLGINFNCNSSPLGNLGYEGAGYGLVASSIKYWDFDISAAYCMTAGMQIDDANGVISQANDVHRFTYVWGTTVATSGSSNGLVIYSTTAGAPQNHIENVQGLICNGDMLRLDGEDNAVVLQLAGDVQTAQQVPGCGSGHTLGLRNSAGSRPAVNNVVLYMSGSVAVDLGTTGNRIELLNGEGGSVNFTAIGNTHSNTTIDGLVTTVGLAVGYGVSGANIPINTIITAVGSSSITLSNAATSTTTEQITFSGGPHLYYRVRDFNSLGPAAVYASTPDYVLGDYYLVPGGAMTATAPTSFAQAGGIWANVPKLPASTSASTQFDFPLPPKARGGLIKQLNLRFEYPSSCAGNESIEVQASSFAAPNYPVGNAINIVQFDQTFTVLTSAMANKMQEATILLSNMTYPNGLPVNAGDTTFWNLIRNTSGTCDPVDLLVISAGLVYQGTGPSVSGQGPWNVPVWPF